MRNPSWLWEESVTCGDWLLLLLVELVGGGSVINGPGLHWIYSYPSQFTDLGMQASEEGSLSRPTLSSF